MNSKKTLLLLTVAAGLMTTAGCGQSGGLRNDLKGKVTLKGRPVASGFIRFNPDAERGNDGPQGAGEIVNGEYTTNPGFGAALGAHVVDITAFSQDSRGAVSHLTKIDITKDRETYDFDIPGTGK